MLNRFLIEPPRGAADLAEVRGMQAPALGARLSFGEFLELLARTPFFV